MRCLTVLLLLVTGTFLRAQTAANWTVSDCSGNSRELFADLDAGKTAVIIWVMPCAYCIDEALKVQSEVKSALASNPGKVVFYLVDDYANTNCATLTSWCTANSITDAIIMSSKTVSMNPYGASGMPKVVIVGADHMVYYNENAPHVNSAGIKAGLTAALAAPTGILDGKADEVDLVVSPNPTNDLFTVHFSLAESAVVQIDVFNNLGQPVSQVVNGQALPGTYDYEVKTSDLPEGVYSVSFRADGRTILKRMVVVH